MLTLDQYNKAPKLDRLRILEDFGTYLELYRYEQDCKVALFDLYGFYVEVWLHEEKDKIVRLYSFAHADSERLEQYLEKIDITQLFSAL